MPAYKVNVTLHGPLYDGLAERDVEDFKAKAIRKLADTGRDWIRVAAMEMDKSGRGGSGRAAEGVLILERDARMVIFGEMKEGEVWWPWLEGTSKRNRSTRFRGYHTFRTTRRRLAQHMSEILRPEIDELTRKLNGGR